MKIIVDGSIPGMAAHAEQICGVPLPEAAKREPCTLMHREPFGSKTHEYLDPGPWEFNPVTRAWSHCERREGIEPYEIPIAFAPGTPESDQIAIATAIGLELDLVPPSPPKDLTAIVTADPFRCWDWKVAWRFFPDLRRWALVPLGPI